MFTNVLDCPHCHHRFGFDHDGQFPETIVCPRCGENTAYENYSALIFCSDCRAKLQVPLDLISAAQVNCPQCGHDLDLHTQFTGEMSDTTLTPGGGNASSRQMLQDGDFIDKYRILQLLGKGGMAEVYLAEHLLLKKFCAIKIMRSSMDSSDNVGIKRFIREAKLAHQLNHPNIVKVFDVGNDPKTGYMFLAMEYVEGQTLLDACRERLLSEEELLQVIESMAEALKVLHEANAVHRDIKPSNIMKTVDGIYKLMDLGIAKAGDSSAGGELTLTMERSTIGTPSYASPEQCQSAHTADIRSDIYCLGTTLYHLATGKLPFDGASPVEIILKVMREEPEPLENLRADLSRKTVALIKSMMKKDPALRPQSPDALLEMLHGKKLIPQSQSLVILKDDEIGDLSEYKDYDQPEKNFFKRIPYRAIWNFLKQLKLMAILRMAILLIAVIYGYHLFRSCQKIALEEDSSADVSPYKRFVNTVLHDADGGAASRQKIPEEPDPAKRVFFHPGVEFSHLRPDSDFLPSMVRDGRLFMDGIFPMDEKAKDHPGYNYRNANSVAVNNLDPKQFIVSFDCKIHPENKGSLLVCGITEACIALNVKNGKLVFEFANETEVDTRHTVPVGQWCTIMFHCDQNEERLRVFVNKSFVGNYHLPHTFDLADKRFTFYNFKKKTAFKGEVDNLRFGSGRFQNLYRNYLNHISPHVPRRIQHYPQRRPVPNPNTVSGAKTVPSVSAAPPAAPPAKVSSSVSSSAAAAEEKNTKEKRAHWVKLPFAGNAHLSYEEAFSLVQGTGKILVLLFVDSTNERCNQFLRQLTASGNAAHNRYVLAVFDFARSGEYAVPEDQYHYNSNLMKRFCPSGGFPTAVFVNGAGRHFRSIHPHRFYQDLSRSLSLLSTGSAVPASRRVVYSGPSRYAPLAGRVKKVRTIRQRLQECQKRLAALNAQSISPWRDKQIEFVKKQISVLVEQEKISRRHKMKINQYSAQKTAAFKAAAEKYLLSRRHWNGYSVRDINEGKKLLNLLKDPGVDPNVYLRNHFNPDQGDPLLYIVATGGLQYQKVFLDLLQKKEVNPNIPQHYYRKINSPPELFFKGVEDIDNAVPVHRAASIRYYHRKNIYNKIQYRKKPLASLLLLAPDLNDVQFADRKTIMHLVVERFDVSMAEKLLLAGFEKDRGREPDRQGKTPWQIAYRRADRKFMAFFKEHGLETPVTHNDTLQHKLNVAFQSQKYDEIRKCIQAGANVLEIHSQGMDLLQRACIRGNLKLVEAILSACAGNMKFQVEMNRRSYGYMNAYHPLQIAAVKKDISLFTLLLRNRINPNVIVWQRYRGYMPLAYAVVVQHFPDPKVSAEQIIAFLQEMRKYGWDINHSSSSLVSRYHYSRKDLGSLLSILSAWFYGKNVDMHGRKLIRILSYFVDQGAEVDMEHWTVRNFLQRLRHRRDLHSRVSRILQRAKRPSAR